MRGRRRRAYADPIFQEEWDGRFSLGRSGADGCAVDAISSRRQGRGPYTVVAPVRAERPRLATAPGDALVPSASTLLSFLPDRVRRLFFVVYDPEPGCRAFLARSQHQENTPARVTVAVPTTAESRRIFGVPIDRHGIQPVFVRVENRSAEGLRLQVVSLDPAYFTAIEAAGVCHHRFLRRLAAFGALGWFLLPLVLLAPLKLLSAWRANRRIDDLFRQLAFRLVPVDPGSSAEGFVFTTADAGTKAVHVRLVPVETVGEDFDREATAPPPGSVADFHFTVPVPGIDADYLRRDFSAVVPPPMVVECPVDELTRRLEALPAATSNAADSRAGDPVNLVVIGRFETLLAAFIARWDESESITLATCWKTAKAFLLGTSYRYSPVSALHLFGRDQDIALQRTRRTINERLHLRLWLAPLAFGGRPVWVGQVSRDIGVRFTFRAWNLTTHRIDPDVDEARDYVLEDLMAAGRVRASGYVDGVGQRGRATPAHNLTGDPWFSDGRRVVILLADTRRDA